MKKLLSLTLAIVLVMSLAVTAFATNVTGDKTNKSTGSTTVSITYDDTSTEDQKLKSYTLVIPATVSPKFNAASTDFLVYLTKANFTTTEQVKVDFNGGTMYMGGDTTSDDQIDFTVKNATVNLGEVGSSTDEANNAVEISTTEWAQAQLGNYSGTMTIEAQIVNK